VFRRILVANRGEIATRIIRACKELNIEAVAIYTPPDRLSLHVKKADQAFLLGDHPVKGYLNPYRIVELAREARCDPLHPGYGFLAEDPRLPELCAKYGITYIGPNAEVITAMGDKTIARQTMIKAGIPIIPGTEDNLASADEAVQWAEKVGFPIMLKATSGGGGRGIRKCADAEELRANYERVLSEAQAAFGRADIFLEKAIENPRHIEFQIMADHHGNVVHLYERDCSIQRRHQKLIEIAPSLFLDDELRAKMGACAVEVAKAVDYRNAGTVEFLVDKDKNFYFMEMNTRIQVEHPVTEAITGIDIVALQIRIAAGVPMPYKQEDIKIRGHAVEFRINAEDPKNNFTPSTGKISRYHSPGGMGVRIDGTAYPGSTITPYFDSMCAKMTIWGMTWEKTVRRCRRALDEFEIRGVKTTIPYFRQIVQTKAFEQGDFDTSYIDSNPELLQYKEKLSREDLALIISATIGAHHGL